MKTLAITAVFSYLSADIRIDRIEPPFWYDCFDNDSLSLLIYGGGFEQTADVKVRGKLKISDWQTSPGGSKLLLKTRVTKYGAVEIILRDGQGGELIRIPYEIRKSEKYSPKPVGPSDAMYLVMPDRFSDGNTVNNIIEGNPDNLDTLHQWGRHGGDIQGIIDHLDYIQETGFTSLWLTPVYENLYTFAYHGYTPSNLYDADPHLGTLDLYASFVNKAHSMGITVVLDHIVNHISPSHPLVQDPPSAHWLNGSPDNFHGCDYRIDHITDRWGDPEKRHYTQEGWFADYLPDMNMALRDVQTYYIQHALWWIQTFGLDGIRQDTWPYSDQEGLKNWSAALKREYPGLFLMAEVWTDHQENLSWFFSDSPRLENSLSSVTDFPFSHYLKGMLHGRMSLKDLYRMLRNDHMYKDPMMLLTFLDNHDLPRFVSEEGISTDDYLNALGLMYSVRGIPMLFYGNEIGLPGGHDPDNRHNFPGGFPGDRRNAFESEGRTETENIIYDRVRLLNDLKRDHQQLFRQDMTLEMQGDSLLVIERLAGAEHLISVYNHSFNPAFLAAEQTVHGSAGIYTDIITGNTSSAPFRIPPRTLCLFLGNGQNK